MFDAVTRTLLVRAWEGTQGREPRVIGLSLPGFLGRTLRDGSPTAASDAAAVLGTQTLSDWLTALRAPTAP